jgi:N-methylhydantoinase A
MVTRIGVDIGGTFTDLVYYDDESAETVEGKVPTVPHAPEQGVINAIREHVPQHVIEKAEYFLHGTTVGLNALLERRGAKVGLITTAGFRDILEIRRGNREEIYNLFWRPHEPLVPRQLRVEVAERIGADGGVIRTLDEATVAAALDVLASAHVDTIAVCLINAYANPAHEAQIEHLLRAAGFNGGISLSHRLSREYREYERTSTTVVDAFVRARMSDYLRKLDQALRDLGFAGRSLITRSGGGSISFSEAQVRAFETIMSGPVAGVQGACEIAHALKIDELLTADVGGTSFDTSLVVEGKPSILDRGMIADIPIQTTWLDVRTIGSGGGSIAYIDGGGLMRVGPRSAGADPGPVSYGKGGLEPTVTDAAAYLGMFGPGELASGIRLDFAGAAAAIAPLAAAIGQSLDATAAGIVRIASSAMANALREVSIEKGRDPRAMTLLPYGGAGPLMATQLADMLEMRRIVVPPFAGNFSAWGLLGSDMIHTVARTRVMDVTADCLPTANQILFELIDELQAISKIEVQDAELNLRCALRYKGQENTLPVEIPLTNRQLAWDCDQIRSAFETDYLRMNNGTLHEPIELVSLRVSIVLPLPRRLPRQPGSPAACDFTTVRQAYSFREGGWRKFRIVSRDAINGPLSGPAIVTEKTTTLYVDAGWIATVGGYGELLLSSTEPNQCH